MCFLTTQILSVSAIVLANVCVSYIMTSQNEEVGFEKFNLGCFGRIEYIVKIGGLA